MENDGNIEVNKPVIIFCFKNTSTTSLSLFSHLFLNFSICVSKCLGFQKGITKVAIRRSLLILHAPLYFDVVHFKRDETNNLYFTYDNQLGSKPNLNSVYLHLFK